MFAAALSIAAGPSSISQHPRVGELCEIHFSRDLVSLPLDATPHLDAVAGWAAEHPAGFVVLDAYPDTLDPADREVAVHRAEAVRAALEGAHVDADRIVIALFGPLPHPGSVVAWGTNEDALAVADYTMAGGGVIVAP
jgi:hypothetical protein